MAARFRSFGCALGLTADTLDKIRADNPHDSLNAMEKVIDTWLAQQYNTKRFGVPCWRKLVSMMALPAGGNNHLLASEIAKFHPGK